MWIDYQRPFFRLSPLQIIALTAYGENRSGGVYGMQSVINVIQNRRLYPADYGYRDLDIQAASGSPYHAVCLKYEQFSVFNLGDPNRAILNRLSTPEAFMGELPNNLSLRTAWNLVQQLQAGTLLEITGGSNHYFALGILPLWARTMVYRTTIAGQRFYAAPPFISEQPQKYKPEITAETPQATNEAFQVVIPSIISGL